MLRQRHMLHRRRALRRHRTRQRHISQLPAPRQHPHTSHHNVLRSRGFRRRKIGTSQLRKIGRPQSAATSSKIGQPLSAAAHNKISCVSSAYNRVRASIQARKPERPSI
jgi:hypothetical protein